MSRGAKARILAGTTAALAGLGWSAASAAAPLAPEDFAPSKVAVVSEVPRGAGTITMAEFRHELLLSSAQAGLKSPPKPGEKRYEKLKTTALDGRLEAIWVFGQAAEWNIYASRHEVKRELDSIKKESFESAAEFRHFVEEAHYSHRDLHERVRTQILSTRIQERLQKMIGGKVSGQKAEQKAFTKFIDEFNERWRSRTVCAPEYVTERCSNGPAG